MDRKTMILVAALAIIVVGVGVGAYILTDSGDNDSGDSDTEPQPGQETRKFVTDAVGRQVPIPDSLDDGIITVGTAGPLRYLSLFDVYDDVIEVDFGDANPNKNGRGFSYAYDYTVKPNHGKQDLTNELVEHIADMHPSLVVMQESVYMNNTNLAEILAKAVTVLVTPGQNMVDFINYDDYTICDTYVESITMVGQILKKEDRAKEHLQDVQNIIDDIRKYVRPGTDPGSTYVAGLTIHGSNVWTTTFPDYMPLRLTGGNNAYTGPADKEGRATLNVEDAMGCILKYENGKYTNLCDRVIIDPSSSDKVMEPQTQKMLEGLYKINNDGNPDNDIDMFVTYPIVWCYINYDCVLAGSYYLCELQYGTLTHDEVVKKVQNVFETFYGNHGKNVPADMADFFIGKSAKFGVELPLIQPVKVVYKDGKYLTEALD